MTTLPKDNLLLIKKVRGSSYLEIRVKSIVVFDDLDAETCKIQLYLHNGDLIEASGVGMVDAIFSGIKEYYGSQFESLKELELVNFFVQAKTKSTKSEVEVILEVRNSYGGVFTFKDNSKSLIASATRVSAAVVEYFCNSEAAFLSVLKAFKDARARGREDLATRYIEELTMLVKNTSYASILDEARYVSNEISGSKK